MAIKELIPPSAYSAAAAAKEHRSAFCIKWSPGAGSLYLLSLNLTSITIRNFSLMVLSKLKGVPLMTSPDGDKGVNSAFGLQCRSCC
ncbi:hypothetical protein EWU14_24120 [Salmonella enterica subsp. enterica serovar Muenchen]|nr:hypothetical protein [Salmonella enterica subsp. enterica serovar Muenchen]